VRAGLAARYPRLQVSHVVRIVFVQIIGKRGVGRGWAASGAAVYPPPRHRIYQVAKLMQGWAGSGAAFSLPLRHMVQKITELVRGCPASIALLYIETGRRCAASGAVITRFFKLSENWSLVMQLVALFLTSSGAVQTLPYMY